MVTFTDPATQEEFSFFVEKRLDENLEKIREKLQKKDKDHLIIIDGYEGSGKSVFGMQMAKRIDPSFCLERVCMNPKQFKEAIVTAKPHQSVIFDEAFTGLSSRGSLSEINRMIVSMMMQMRQKNLFVIIILPTVFMVDKYVALSRAKGLFHVWEKNGRHYWRCFNKQRLKQLILTGAKTYSYNQVARYISYKGHFYGKYILDEEKYRDKKRKALEEAEVTEKVSKYLVQRDRILCGLYKDHVKSFRTLSKWLEGVGVKLSHPQLVNIHGKATENEQNGRRLLV